MFPRIHRPQWALRMILVLLVACAALLPQAQSAQASSTPVLAQEPPLPLPVDESATDVLPDGKTVVEHWVGTGTVRESYEHFRSPGGVCFTFCESGVIDSSYRIDLRVYQDGSASGTAVQQYMLAHSLTADHCHAGSHETGTMKIHGCTLSYEQPSGVKTWTIEGRRYRVDELNQEYLEFRYGSDDAVPGFEVSVKGCEEQTTGPCKPYYNSGVGLDVGLHHFAKVIPTGLDLPVDTTTYGRPAIVYDYEHVLSRPGDSPHDPYDHVISTSWRLFEVGVRPTLELDRELLERSVFMHDVPLTNLFQANVDWSAVGGGSTRWTLNTNADETPLSPVTVIPRNFDVGALPVASHPLHVSGRNTLGRQTNEVSSVLVIAPLVRLCGPAGYTVTKAAGMASYKCTFRLPNPALSANIKKMPDWFPYLGGEPFGIKETQLGVDVEVKSTGEGTVKGLGQMGFEAMGGAIIGTLGVTGDVVLLPSGAKLTGGSMDIWLSGKLKKEKPLVEIMPQFAAAVAGIGKLSPSAATYLKDLAKLGIEFEPRFSVSPKFKNEDGGEVEWGAEEVGVGAGLKAVLSLTLLEDVLVVEASAGGRVQVVFVLPPNPDYFKKADAKVALAFKVRYWKFVMEGERAFTWSYSNGGAAAADAGGMPSVESATAEPTWTLADRSYLSAPDYAQWAGRALTETKPVDFALMNNVGALVNPVLVSTFAGSTLFWSQERPDLPALGSDELAFARGTVSNWSVPGSYLTDDNVADWNPKAITRSGGTLLVWQRMDKAEPGDLNAEPGAFLAHSQIAAAFLADGAASVTPVQISTSGSLNHRPQLAPTTNGAMAMWVNNPSNVIVGDGAHRDALLVSEYDQWSKTWSPPSTAVANIPGVIDYAFATFGSQAAVLFLTDVDGDPATPADRELYYARYASGTWGAPVRMTNNAATERDLAFQFAADGLPRAIWRAGDQLYFLTDWNAAPVVLPFSVAPLAGNLRLVDLKQGRLALLWTEAAQGGQRIVVSVYTPAVAGWSLPQPLALEEIGGTPAADSMIDSVVADPGSLAFAGASVPGLMVAYTEAAVGVTTRTLPAYDGSGTPVTAIPEMAALGKRTLRMAYIPLKTDLRVAPSDIVVTPASQQVGGAVVVSATVHNTGLFAVEGVTAALSSFPVNDPASVTIVGSHTLPLLAGGESRTLTFSLSRPQVADRLYLVSVGSTTNGKEWDRNDNVAFVGTDAQIVEVGPTNYAGEVATIPVLLRQQSALPAPVTTEVGVRLGAPNGPLIGSTTAVLPAAPGVIVTASVPVDIPPLGPGRHTVYVDIDPNGASGDWNPTNDVAGSTVVAQPDLTSLPLLSQQSGDAYRLWVQNDGPWASPATTVAFFDRPPTLAGAVQVGSANVPSLQPGEMAKVEAAAVANSVVAADASARYVLIDPLNLVAEISEADNTLLLDAGGEFVAQPPPGSTARIYLPLIQQP